MFHKGPCDRIGFATTVMRETVLSRDAVGQKCARFSDDETDVEAVEEPVGRFERLLGWCVAILRAKVCAGAEQDCDTRR